MKKVLPIILIAIVALTGCKNKGAATTDDKTTMTKDTLTYLALGDSYTVGESIPPDQSFPYQLARSLTTDSVHVGIPTIIATTGWTTDDLLGAITASDIHNKTYDLVTVLIGVNDQYQGLSQSDYRVEFKKLLDTAINFAKGDKSRVFVLSIPDWGVTPYADGQSKKNIAPEIDQFNAINKAESEKAGTHYLDITPMSRQIKTDTSLLAIDELHPSGKMYGLWVNKLAPMVKARLAK
jgi:lysophospholipase L1-like esterase